MFRGINKSSFNISVNLNLADNRLHQCMARPRDAPLNVPTVGQSFVPAAQPGVRARGGGAPAPAQRVAARAPTRAARRAAARARRAELAAARLPGHMPPGRAQRARSGPAVQPVDRGIRSGNGRDALAAYARSLIDPWSGPAHIPQRVAPASTPLSVKQTVTVTAPSVNPVTNAREVCFVLRGGIYAMYAASGKLIENGGVHQYLSTWTVSSGASPVNASYPRNDDGQCVYQFNNTANYFAVYAYEPALEYAALQSTFTAYRKVSQGLRVTYTGPPLDAQGKCVIATIPGTQRPSTYAPTAYVAGTTLGMNPITQQTLSFDSLATLLDAQTYGAAEGCTHVWAPSGDQIDMWRPTRYVPIAARNGTNGIFGITSFPVCDSDPQAFQGMADALTSIQYLPNNLWTTIGGATAASSTKAQQLAIQHATCADDPIVVFFATGLDDTASYSFEWVVNYEGIPDNRALSLVQPQQNMVRADDGAQAVRALVASMPRAAPGPHGDRAFARIAAGVRDAVAGVGSAAKRAAEVGRTILNVGQSVLPIASNVMRVMGMPQEAALADAIGAASSAEELLAIGALAI